MPGARAALALVALALGACAGTVPRPSAFPGPPELPARTTLAVPFFAQDEYQCGPAALASVLGYAGVPRRPEDLVAQVYVPQRHGSLQAEMLAAARRAGLVAYRLAPQPAQLQRELAAGHPVLVLQNLRLAWWPRWHYAVVIGYDRAGAQWILHSGEQAAARVDDADFERSWDLAGDWAFVALPPGELPAGADEAAYVAAVAELERVAPAAAAAAYETALQRWPQDLVARIGIGNIAYARHDLDGALAAYRQATQAHADSGDAWNNLAQVLHDLGQDDAAISAARRAVELGGARIATYRATLQQCLGQRAESP